MKILVSARFSDGQRREICSSEKEAKKVTARWKKEGPIGRVVWHNFANGQTWIGVGTRVGFW